MLRALPARSVAGPAGRLPTGHRGVADSHVRLMLRRFDDGHDAAARGGWEPEHREGSRMTLELVTPVVVVSVGPWAPRTNR